MCSYDFLEKNGLVSKNAGFFFRAGKKTAFKFALVNAYRTLPEKKNKTKKTDFGRKKTTPKTTCSKIWESLYGL